MSTAEATENTEAPAEQDKAAAKNDFTKYVVKAPTNLHRHYWDWIKEKTGIELDATDEDAVKIVQIAVSAYQTYQASPENKKRRQDEAEAKLAAAEEAKAAKAAAAAEKAAAKAKAAEDTKAEAAAAGETGTATRQPPPRKGSAKGGGAAKAAAGEAPF